MLYLRKAYTVIVTNAYGSVTSSPASLIIADAPVIVSAPVGQKVIVGSNANFSVTAAGVQPLVYQWFFNGGSLGPAATGASLQLLNVQPSQGGSYAVVVTNAFGAVTSAPVGLEVFPPGTVTVASSVRRSRPVPRHTGHGGSTISPVCPQRGHGVSDSNVPRNARRAARLWPVPPHSGHVETDPPGAAPEPSHRSHVASRV